MTHDSALQRADNGRITDECDEGDVETSAVCSMQASVKMDCMLVDQRVLTIPAGLCQCESVSLNKICLILTQTPFLAVLFIQKSKMKINNDYLPVD